MWSDGYSMSVSVSTPGPCIPPMNGRPWRKPCELCRDHGVVRALPELVRSWLRETHSCTSPRTRLEHPPRGSNALREGMGRASAQELGVLWWETSRNEWVRKSTW